jgi:hypothetical protein
VYLPQEWHGDFASGSASYAGVTDVQENAWYLQHDLELEWDSQCLHGQDTEDDAQRLSVNIKAIDGKQLQGPYPGFSISYKQRSRPELLRLEAGPYHDAQEEDSADSWRAPPAHLRIVTASKEGDLSSVVAPIYSDLEADIEELKALQREREQLDKIIAEKQKYISAQVESRVQTFKEELRQCDNVTCVFKTLAGGAHSAWRIVYTRFRPQHHFASPSTSSMGRLKDDFRVSHGGYNKISEGKVDITSDAPHRPAASSSSTPQSSESSHHGAPRMPPPGSPFVIAIEIVLGVLCCGCLIKVLQSRCCSLRSRTERAAAAEERRNAAAYRRAARKLAWRKWWRGNWRDQERIEDYEEKRSLIQHQESILEDAMQEEIRQLRAAHGVVNDIVQAEEGRGASYATHHCHCAHHPPNSPRLSTTSTYPPTSIPEMPSRPLSRTGSLPSYRSGATSPPAYESEEEEDMSETVANGFRNYAISSTSGEESGSRWTPDSSVVDVSPRPSADTLRSRTYAEMSETGVGDEKH